MILNGAETSTMRALKGHLLGECVWEGLQRLFWRQDRENA